MEMKDKNSSRPLSEAFYRVRTEKQASLLSSVKGGDFIHPFMERESSVSAAAQALGCSVQTMHYRVKQLLAAGLLEVVREEKRAGRAVKHYRAVSEAFFIPDDLTKYADLEERFLNDLQPTLQEIAKGLAEGIRREGRTGQCTFRDGKGGVSSYGCVERPDRGIELNLYYPFRLPNTDRRGKIYLTNEEARELGRELGNLFDRYLDLPRDGSEYPKAYIFMYALVSSPE
jgi:transposase-like protein